MKKLFAVPIVAAFLWGSSEAPEERSSAPGAHDASVAENAGRVLPDLAIAYPSQGSVIEYDHFDADANVLTVRVDVRREGGRADHANLCAVRELLVTVVPTGGKGGDLIANEGALFRGPGSCPTSATYEFSWDFSGKAPGTYDILVHVEASSPLDDADGYGPAIELIGVNEGTRIILVDPEVPGEARGERGVALAMAF